MGVRNKYNCRGLTTTPEAREEYRRKHHHIRQLVYRLVKMKYTCIECGESDPRCLEFHHTNPSEKYDEIHDLFWKGASMNRIEIELAKCVALCANCHHKLHAGSFDVCVPDNFDMMSVHDVLALRTMKHG